MQETLQVFLVSLWDVRIAMPLAIILGFTPWQAFLMATSGALVIGPFLMMFRELLEVASRRTPKLVRWLLRLNDRNSKKIEKYGYWGLFLFVALPVPGTGAWAGAFLSGLLQMHVWKSFLVILLGITISGGLSMLLTALFV